MSDLTVNRRIVQRAIEASDDLDTLAGIIEAVARRLEGSATLNFRGWTALAEVTTKLRGCAATLDRVQTLAASLDRVQTRGAAAQERADV
jgi:hypothetical protein